MSPGSTNEAATEGLDLNSEAVPFGEEDVSVVRVTESMVSDTVYEAETLVEQASDAQGPAQDTNHERGTAEAGVYGEGRNFLEMFAQGSDVCDGSTGTHEFNRSSEEESADVGLIKEDSERRTKESVDAGGDGKFGGQPDVALTLKLSASDAEELKDRGEVTEAESSMTITELASEKIHVASGEKAVELEISEVSNPGVDVPMDLDEKPTFPEKNQGVEVEGVGGSTEANGVGDTDPSVSLGSLSSRDHNTTLSTCSCDMNPSQDGIKEIVTQVAEKPYNQAIRDRSMDLHLREENAEQEADVTVDTSPAATEAVHEPKTAVLDQNQDADVQIAGACGSDYEDQRMGSPSPVLGAPPLVENQTMGFDAETAAVGGCCKLHENRTESQTQAIASDSEVVVSVVDLDSLPCADVKKKTVEEVLNEDEQIEVKEIEADAPPLVENQTMGFDVETGAETEVKEIEADTPPLVENQTMGFDVETAAVGGCCKLDENQTESQTQAIASDSDVVIPVVDLDSRPCTDVKKKTVKEVLNEDEQTEVKEIEADAPLLVENQTTGFDVETAAVGGCCKLDENQTESQSQAVASDSDVVISVVDLDSRTCTDVKKETVEEVLNEDEQTEVKEIEADAPPLVENQTMGFDVETSAVGDCCKLDENQTESQTQAIACDSDSRPCTDVKKKTLEEVLNEDERAEVKEIEADATHFGTDGKQKTVHEVSKEDGGTVAKEMGDNVTSPGSDENQKTVDGVFEEDGSRVKEMQDDDTCWGRDENQNTADNVIKEDEGTGVKEMTDNVTHLDKEDVDKKTADKVHREETEVREVGDGISTDGNLKAVDEIFQKDEGTEVKDENQMIIDDDLKEGEGTEAKEMGDDVTHLSSDGDERNVEEIVKEDEGPGVKERERGAKDSVSDCLGENLTKDVSGDHSYVNQKIETSEQVTTTLNPGTASVNDNRVFYGMATEEEGEFSVSDLVWGKVKSHPWWPGQIFDPKDASEQAMKYRKKDSFLVAYFGDQTFAWNEASLLKPFRTHFSHMEKQTNVESFRKAVNSALDEVARRVELGLACSCTSEAVCSKIRSQMIRNSGIQEESSRREGVDESLSVSSFEPGMLVEYIRALALFPCGGVDRLELVIAQMQLLAFYRSRGYSCLPKFQLCGSLVENEADSSILAERKHSIEIVDDSAVMSENEDQVLTEKVKLKSRDGSSRKRKHTSVDGVYPNKKERSLSELMADDGNESVEVAASKAVSSSSGNKRKAGDSFPDDSVIQNRKRNISLFGAADADSAQPKRSFKVGESICRVASQLTGSPQILKCSSERLHRGTVKVDHSSEKSAWDGDDVSPRTPEQRRKIVLPTEHSSPEEMLSQLCLAARDPMKGYSFLTTITSFFSEFRNFVCLDHTSSWKHKMFSEKAGGRKKKLPNSNMDSTESYSFEDMQDSYWTDRIVQISLEEQPLEKSQKKRGRPRKKMAMLTNGSDNSHQWSPALDIVQQNPDGSAEQPVEIPMGSVDANSYNSPTALILSFSESEADSIPSEKNLNRIFKHFGPLKESETEVLMTTNCARVVFKNRTDAEVALSSAGKFSIFGPMHVSYMLMCWPSTSAKAPSFAATQGTEGFPPQHIEDMAPQGIEDMAPQGIEDMAPQGIEDVAPQGIEDVAPQCIEDVAPQGIEDMAAQDREDMAPQDIGGMTPQGIEDIAPQGIEDTEPQGMEDMAPQSIEYMSPQGVEDMAGQGIEDMAAQGIQDMEPQGIEDVAPAGGNTS